jgi:hypothetical protein
MTAQGDRRTRIRYALARPWKGSLRLMRDVHVLRGNCAELAVLCVDRCGAADAIRLHLTTGDRRVSSEMRLVGCRPVIARGSLQHRLILAADPQSAGSADFSSLLASPDLLCVLERNVAISVLEVSTGGCRLESFGSPSLSPVARLTAVHEGESYSDDIRIVRAGAVAGAGERTLLGAAFLWTDQPAAQSLRRLVFDMQVALDVTPEALGSVAWGSS